MTQASVVTAGTLSSRVLTWRSCERRRAALIGRGRQHDPGQRRHGRHAVEQGIDVALVRAQAR
ncbi:hypothetical protein CKW48_21805, partial [Bordetella pertussis]